MSRLHAYQLQESTRASSRSLGATMKSFLGSTIRPIGRALGISITWNERRVSKTDEKETSKLQLCRIYTSYNLKTAVSSSSDPVIEISQLKQHVFRQAFQS